MAVITAASDPQPSGAPRPPPVAASPALLDRPASPAWHAGPGYPARPLAPAAGTHRDVTLPWPGQRRCDIAVADGTAPVS
jgi:hypothetical protein